MKTVFASFAALFLLCDFCTAPAWAADAEGSKDHPLFTRMPGNEISRYEERAFDAHPFRIAGGKEISVAGKVLEIHYTQIIDRSPPERS